MLVVDPLDGDLSVRCGVGVRATGDRSVNGSVPFSLGSMSPCDPRTNIDHLTVTPTGVYLIDAKKYRGRPHLKVEGGLLPPE